MAQACHAVAGWLCDNPDSVWRNNTIVILAVDDVGEWASGLVGKWAYWVLAKTKKNVLIFIRKTLQNIKMLYNIYLIKLYN